MNARNLYPTKNRLALLGHVADGDVFQDVIGDSYISGQSKVTVRIAEMAKAGWVHLADKPLSEARTTRNWRPTDLGSAILRAVAIAPPDADCAVPGNA